MTVLEGEGGGIIIPFDFIFNAGMQFRSAASLWSVTEVTINN